MRRKSTPVDAESIYTIVNESGQPQIPTFRHKDLADACLRILSKNQTGFSEQKLTATDTEGGANEALAILSREQRWLNLAKGDKTAFDALCEGWMTVPRTGGQPLYYPGLGRSATN